MQCALSFAFPWAAFYTAEAFELSGIVSIMFCGMIMNLYCKQNFSDAARDLSSKGYHWVAMVAETYIFVYLGMAVFTFPIFQHTTLKLVGVAIGACFVGRLHIYVGSIMTNCCRAKDSKPPPISCVSSPRQPRPAPRAAGRHHHPPAPPPAHAPPAQSSAPLATRGERQEWA